MIKKTMSFRSIVLGMIKDKASLSKATNHDPLSSPNHRHIARLLSFGHGSRSTASIAVEALMDRLNITRNACVALKCLILIHHIIKQGSFILQDQLSIYPSSGGRNYLKLCGFRDGSSPLSWEVSSWVRWYSLYLEDLLSTARSLGFFLSSTSSTMDKDRAQETIAARSNSDLYKELDSLVCLLEHTCKIPEPLNPRNKTLSGDVNTLVGEDYLSVLNEATLRLNELRQRLGGRASFEDSVEFTAKLRRLEECKESLSAKFRLKRAIVDGFWELVSESKSEIGRGMIAPGGKRGGGTESARFDLRVLDSSGSVWFGSCRYTGTTELGSPVFDFV